MSTNARIAIQKNENDFDVIYLHWDGYPSHAMKMLLANYNSEELATELVALGDLSGVDETLETCQAYYRDRGEDWSDVMPSPANSMEMLREDAGGDYLYVWMDGKWNASGRGNEIRNTDWAEHD